MGFRFFDPNPQERDNLGQLCALGTLVFFENGDTNTPKSVYGEPALSTDLGNEIALDASARPADDIDIWCDGEYTVQLLDKDGAQVWLKDDYRATDAAAAPTLPDPATGEDGQVLAILDGIYTLLTLLLLPDPAGNSGRQLGNDGELVFWEDKPAATVYDADNLPGGIEQGSTSFQVGKFLVQTGTGTLPASGALTANVIKTFDTAYATLLHVDIQITGSGGSTPQGAKPGISYVGSPTSFTAYAYANDEHDNPGWLLTSTTPFTWVAYGLVA